MKKDIEIKTDGEDIIVTDRKTEYFRKPKTNQTISIANDIYFQIKYNEQEKREHRCA